jgi:hypothetical protein
VGYGGGGGRPCVVRSSVSEHCSGAAVYKRMRSFKQQEGFLSLTPTHRVLEPVAGANCVTDCLSDSCWLNDALSIMHERTVSAVSIPLRSYLQKMCDHNNRQLLCSLAFFTPLHIKIYFTVSWYLKSFTLGNLPAYTSVSAYNVRCGYLGLGWAAGACSNS